MIAAADTVASSSTKAEKSTAVMATLQFRDCPLIPKRGLLGNFAVRHAAGPGKNCCQNVDNQGLRNADQPCVYSITFKIYIFINYLTKII